MLIGTGHSNSAYYGIQYNEDPKSGIFNYTGGIEMKKITALLTIIFISLLLCSCKIADSIDNAGAEEDGTSSEVLPGFPENVPINSNADITESSKENDNGVTLYYIHMEYSGTIAQLSNWYEQELAKDWQVDSVSRGDYDDWSEFYTDAQDDQYYLTVYLYQDAGSSVVSVDINVEAKTVSTEEETSEEVAVEDGTSANEETAATDTAVYTGELENARISFVCASVGYAWNINEHFPGLDIDVHDEYQFDKGYVIMEILANNNPDIMIIKECAAYFPPENNGSSMEAYQNLIRDWVNLCRGDGVIPVLTTVVPIDPDNPSNSNGQLESLLEYNDWIHEYCMHENISVLDLEAALRVSDTDRSLDPYYDSGDGLHPNDMAYPDRFDPILIPALEQALDFGH